MFNRYKGLSQISYFFLYLWKPYKVVGFNTANVDHAGKFKFTQSHDLMCILHTLSLNKAHALLTPHQQTPISSSPVSFFLSRVRKQGTEKWKGLAGSRNSFPQSSLYFVFLSSFLEQIQPHDPYSSPLLFLLLNWLFANHPFWSQLFMYDINNMETKTTIWNLDSFLLPLSALTLNMSFSFGYQNVYFLLNSRCYHFS